MRLLDRFRGSLGSTGLWLLIAALLVACSIQSPKPIQPVPVKVRLPPELSSATLIRALEQCVEAQPQIDLALQVAQDSTLTTGDSDLVISIGNPAEQAAFSAPLAVQELAVIAHPDNPLQTLDLDDLRAIFSGRLTSWDELGGPDQPVQPWSYFQGSQMESVFAQVILQGAQISSQTLLANEPEAVRLAVADDPGAIGYIPGAWLDGSVQQISLEQEIRDELQQPIIASTESEPEGHIRNFLHCLQSGPGQDILMQSYLAWTGS